MPNIEIITEDLRGCINYIASTLPPRRYYVIATPINATGICKQFPTLQEAEQYAAALRQGKEC